MNDAIQVLILVPQARGPCRSTMIRGYSEKGDTIDPLGLVMYVAHSNCQLGAC
jgi:hypothetical protein